MIEVSSGFYWFLVFSCLFSLIFGLIGTIIGLIAIIKVVAMEKSTHTVTFKPMDEEIDKENNEFLKNWATKESRIAKDHEMYKEDLETEMPDFFPTEEDTKKYSF